MVRSEIEQQRPKLEDLRELGRVLSDGGASKLVEPRLLPVNKRWTELDFNFAQVRQKSVSLHLSVKIKMIDNKYNQNFKGFVCIIIIVNKSLCMCRTWRLYSSVSLKMRLY